MADITADELYRNSHLHIINQTINDIYRAICAKIREVHQSGSSELFFDLPDTFAIGNIKPDDAQLIIYSRIIERLDKGGLDVKILREENGSSLCIRWPSALDPNEKKRMKKIIIEHAGVVKGKKK